MERRKFTRDQPIREAHSNSHLAAAARIYFRTRILCFGVPDFIDADQAICHAAAKNGGPGDSPPPETAAVVDSRQLPNDHAARSAAMQRE
jgi:hypothetical protein